MKVNNNSSSTQTGTVRGSDLTKTGKSTKAKSEAGNALADIDSAKVELSQNAQAMSKAKEIATKDTDNSAKVARLQKLIDSGQYKVDSEAVADKLVNEHLAMGD
jgi:negative regulator of flagellin synthesis FlgM